MKVYVVTAGEYSDYHIDAIFTNEDIANQYANLDSERNVEEYETDIESVNPDPNKLVYFVTYDFEKDKIDTLCLTSGHSRGEDFVYDYQTVFGFYVSPSETLDNSIRMFGHNSDWLKKIAQDRFYMYCDTHETSRSELIQKKTDRYRKYNFITTSIGPNMHDPPFSPNFVASQQMAGVMKKYFEEHGEYPDMCTVRKLFDEQRQEAIKEHGED